MRVTPKPNFHGLEIVRSRSNVAIDIFRWPHGELGIVYDNGYGVLGPTFVVGLKVQILSKWADP